MHKSVAIHQPNFFPWLGYFDKICRADIFIFLDDAQFPKKGGSWSNRVKILHQGKPRWLTAPIERAYSGTRAVNAMHFSPEENWRTKTARLLQTSYVRAPHFEEGMALLEPLIMHQSDNLADYNIAAVTSLCMVLRLDTGKLKRSSSFGVEMASTERLVALTQAAGGTEYLCGGGAGGYQDDALFAQAGLRLRYQDFQTQPYAQLGAPEFVPGLSVIDVLMHIGVAALAARFETVSRGATA